MACTSPLRGYRNPTTKQIEFVNRKETLGRFGLITVRCGVCMGCRIDRARSWGIRCWHESQLHEDNCFITLTYDHQNIPQHHSLHKPDFQNFIRAMRKKLRPKGVNIRYFAGGEYGTQDRRCLGRPHYHAILFGWRPADGIPVGRGKKGHKRYISKFLTDTWGKGMAEWGEVTYRSANYTAKYCLKKIHGKGRDQTNPETGLKPYERIYEFSGEIVQVEPEFLLVSLKPAIGKKWYEKFSDELWATDNVAGPEGQEWPVPEYYTRLLKAENEAKHYQIIAARQKKAKLYYSTLNEDAKSEHQRILAREAKINHYENERGQIK